MSTGRPRSTTGSGRHEARRGWSGVTDKLPLEDRVEAHREAHPDASIPAIAGALGADPDDVREVLDENSRNQGVDLNSRTADRVPGSPSRPPKGPKRDLPAPKTESNVYPENLLDRRMWMPWQYVDERKIPSAVYADTDEPMSYPNPDNWRDFETVDMACVDPRLEGPSVVLQHEDDPYADRGDPFFVVDYDDVRDPEIGAIHPVVADHFERADTYADISTSETGAHLIGTGSLPEGVKTIQAALPDHDAFPDAEVEVYDGKRFVAMTGEHVVGTPTGATDGQSFLEDLVDEFVDEQKRLSTPSKPDNEVWDPEYDRDDLENIEETEDMQAVIDAIQQVEPRDIRLQSSQTEDRADGTLSFDPSWEHSKSGTRLGWDPDIGWIYRKGGVGLDAVQVVALEERIISSPRDYPEGEDWWDTVEALRDRGAHIPELDTSAVRADDQDLPPLLDLVVERDEDDVDAAPTSTLPLAQLDVLAPQERRRAARKRGLDWPDTEEARDRLLETIQQIIRHEDDRVVDAPTSLGKTFSVATTRWGAREDITGERPVVHLLETRDARDEAIEAAEEHGGQFMVLRSRHEACPVAAGDHDPCEAQECDDDSRQALTVDGEPASHVIDALCDGKGLPFSVAHQFVADHNDQGIQMPCEQNGPCEAIKQWDRYRAGPSGNEDDSSFWPLVIATHNFSYAPGLRTANNIVVDEQPDFTTDLSTDRIRRAVTAYLQAIDATITTWEDLVALSQHDGYADDAAAEREALENDLWAEPEREWYLQNDDAHVLAPALARAVFYADERPNGRRFGKTPHQPPRLEAHAHDEDYWNREWVNVVLDEQNDVRTVRVVPDFGAARSVVGLDAHPSLPVWRVNNVPWIGTEEVLNAQERQLWRRYERGLRVVQVGDATRPLSGSKVEEWLDENRLQTLLEHLRDEQGSDFKTALTTAQVEDRVEALMHEAGIQSPELMHYGEEKSRNDFEDEAIGLVNGAMDPGDDYVLNLLAELDLEAEVETAVDDEGEEYRARGRGFDGEDADAAAEILASVRENHIAQAAGRYARNPEDPDSTATVFLRTDAAPTGFVDVEVPGVEWTYSDLQREIVDELRSDHGASTAREIGDSVACSKEHVRQTLKRLEQEDVVQAIRGEGGHGATLYADDGTPNSGVVDVDEIANDPLLESTSRWSLAIRDPDHRDRGGAPGGDDSMSSEWDWESATDGGGPPD